jgi:hypothetical protein
MVGAMAGTGGAEQISPGYVPDRQVTYRRPVHDHGHC